VPELRLYIPVKENPGYNFIGLIIGPRGNTQKRLQSETGARIAIRGRGSEKEGTKAKVSDGMDDDLHVHICADTIEKVDKAARLVHPLLTPLDAEHNMHKQRQLRELAEINGTIKDVSKLQEMLVTDEQNATMYKLNPELQV
jgi:splicing factor 1